MFTKGISIFSLAVIVLLFQQTSAQTVIQQSQSKEKTPQSPTELFNRASGSVLVVEAFGDNGSIVALGSAVVVQKQGNQKGVGVVLEAITNLHVAKTGKTLKVKRGSFEWPATVIHADDVHDLCSLDVPGLSALAAEIRPAIPAIGERVYAIGAPEGFELTLSEGLISGIRDYHGYPVIQTTAPISHGSSGGGLFDASGRLVGITTFFIAGGQSLNFAIPSTWIFSLAEHSSSFEDVAAVDDRVSKKIDEGNSAFQQDNFEIALSDYKDAIQINPDSGLAWTRLGDTYLRLGQGEAAVAALEQATSKSPDSAIGWIFLGRAHYMIGDFAKAVLDDQQAIGIYPNLPSEWMYLGEAYEKLHNTDGALRAFKKAVDIDHDFDLAWFKLGSLEFLLNDYDKSISALKEAIRIKPDYWQAWELIGSENEPQKRFGDAIGAYKEATRLNPDAESSWVGILDCYDDLNDLSNFEATMPQATAHVHTKSLATVMWVRYMNLLRRKGKRKEAEDIYKLLDGAGMWR